MQNRSCVKYYWLIFIQITHISVTKKLSEVKKWKKYYWPLIVNETVTVGWWYCLVRRGENIVKELLLLVFLCTLLKYFSKGGQSCLCILLFAVFLSLMCVLLCVEWWAKSSFSYTYLFHFCVMRIRYWNCLRKVFLKLLSWISKFMLIVLYTMVNYSEILFIKIVQIGMVSV